ncbi:MAG TPA: serine hydrolase [Longimicrobiales bacterium]
MRRHALTALFLLAAPAAPLASQTPDRAALTARIDSIVNAAIGARGAPGISIAVVRGADTIALEGYGLADVENEVPVTDRSVFRIGSVTKQFTAAAVMKLVDQGRIRLDAPLSEYLPDYPGPGARVTIHHLLNHTSGIPSYTGMGPDFWNRSRLDLTHEEMLDLFARDSLEFEPGSRWEYNNSGYYLLGVLIEKVTGQPYDQHVRGALFEPLGLAQTMYCHQAPIIPHRVQGYARDAGTLVNAAPLSMNPPGAAGALCSTARDLIRWTDALMAGRVVSTESLARMMTATSLTTGTTNPYGYGLTNGQLGPHEAIQHGGGINGFTAFLARYPEQDLTIAVLANGPTDAGALQARIARAVLGLPEPPIAQQPEVPIDAAALERYTGTYDLAPTVPIQVRIFIQDERLMGQGTNQSAFPLRHVGEHTFVGPPESGVRIVFTIENDRATSFTLHQGGGTVPARRID